MQIKLHKLAKTTLAIIENIYLEWSIHNKKRTRKELVRELKLSIPTIKKWCNRDKDDLFDRSHAKHNLNLLLNILKKKRNYYLL